MYPVPGVEGPETLPTKRLSPRETPDTHVSLLESHSSHPLLQTRMVEDGPNKFKILKRIFFPTWLKGLQTFGDLLY